MKESGPTLTKDTYISTIVRTYIPPALPLWQGTVVYSLLTGARYSVVLCMYKYFLSLVESKSGMCLCETINGVYIVQYIHVYHDAQPIDRACYVCVYYVRTMVDGPMHIHSTCVVDSSTYHGAPTLVL